MRHPYAVVAALLLCLPSAAQTIVLPRGLAGGVGNGSNSFPWGANAAAFPGLRVLTCYDSSNFTLAGVTTPIRITGLRWRANDGATSWTGGTFAQATVTLSTAAVDHLAVSSVFAANHGVDATTVWTGPVQFRAGVGAGVGRPGTVVVDLPLQTPFVYDPGQGDLCIDVDYPGGANFAGGTLTAMDVHTGTAAASRVYGSTLYPGANGTTTHHGAVVEVQYVPADGLFAAFECDPPAGPTPLPVRFVDASYSSAPGGVTSWAWDFDGDGIIDSSLPNPVHVFTTCGSHTVSLTVADGAHTPSTRTEVDCVVTDRIVADFTFQALGGNTLLFTDTSVPAATSQQWDLDGDGVFDALGGQVVWTYPASTTPVAVTLQSSRLCGPASTCTKNVLPQPALPTTFAAGNGLSQSGAGNVFDLEVTHPVGIDLLALTVCPYSTGTPLGAPIQCELWLCAEPGGFVDHHADPTAWRLVAVGNGTFQGSNSTAVAVPTAMALDRRVFLPPGRYSMAVHMFGCGLVYSSSPPAALDYANADLRLHNGIGKTAPFNGAANSPRVWNGVLHYDVCQLGGLGGYGYFGSGCDSSLGEPVRQSAQGLPTPGQVLTLTFGPVPGGVAFCGIGISHTQSQFGPLPIDLTPLEAAGCALRISLDDTRLLFGTPQQVQYPLAIPNNPTLLCVPIYLQALVPDPAANAFGWTFSDAAAVLIGN